MKTQAKRFRPVSMRALGHAVHVEACGRQVVMLLGTRSVDGGFVQTESFAIEARSAGLARSAAPRAAALMEQFGLTPEASLRAAVQHAEAAYAHALRRAGRSVA